jgi:uracil-DNA glycosylase
VTPVEFDAGYGDEPWRTLCAEFPGEDVYPPADFRTEWGPIFHRGRLDGTARVLVIGQDPAQHESIARRILVGEAGQRVQGFLAKLGFTRSYVMVNTYLYSAYGQGAANRYRDDADIAEYRHAWLDAIAERNPLEAIVAVGSLGRHACDAWMARAAAGVGDLGFAHITHPTAPEAGGGEGDTYAERVADLLRDWNEAVEELRPHIANPDMPARAAPYTEAFVEGEIAPIPPADLPAGLPAWMGGREAWARRDGDTPEEKRATITITVPDDARPWT